MNHPAQLAFTFTAPDTQPYPRLSEAAKGQVLDELAQEYRLKNLRPAGERST